MKFKVGDKVRVRSWNAMKREFGVDEETVNGLANSIHERVYGGK